MLPRNGGPLTVIPIRSVNFFRNKIKATINPSWGFFFIHMKLGSRNGQYQVVVINYLNLEFACGIRINGWRKKRPECNFFFSTLKGKKLSIRYLQQMVKRYAQKARINKNVSPHTLRHTYATEYYKQTKDIETLRRILGHSNIGTTTIYITLANIDVENGMKSFKGFL